MLTRNIKYDILLDMNVKGHTLDFKINGIKALHQAMMEAKKRSGLNQKEIAERSGMAQPNISRIERGRTVSFNAFSEYLAACGFDFTVKLFPVDRAHERSIRQ